MRTLQFLLSLGLLPFGLALASPPATRHVARVDFHVSPRGDDDAVGTAERPFATLRKARDAIRALKRERGLPPGGVTVWIAEGSYHPAEPLEFTADDAGTREAPITFRARPGARVRITGGRELQDIRPVRDAGILERLDTSARARVLQSDLKAAGIRDLGEVTRRGERLELVVGDRPLTLARWPNEGFARIAGLAGGKPHAIHGIQGNKEGKIIYEGDRPRRWAGEKDIWLHGYWFWDWSDSYEKVQSIDLDKRVISLTPPYHHYGYRQGQRYRALNVLAELDSPGEWYLDRKSGVIYFWPPPWWSPLAKGAGSAVVTVSKHILTLRGCSWWTLRGVILECTRSTPVTVEGGSHVRVAGCLIRNTGSWGVRISGGSDHEVVSCAIHGVGEGGIALGGGDRRTLTPARHLAANNHIHHFGRLYRTYRPAVSVSGVGNRVAHNHIHDGPHNAIQLGGNDHMIEYNDIHHVCFETGDVGAFYMGRDWTARGTIIRYNYFHDIKGPGLYGAMAVYLDDAASGITVAGNVFYRAGRAAFIGGGRDNLVENNIFVECAPSVHVDSRGAGWMKYHVEGNGTLPTRLKAMPVGRPPWSTRYPKLVNILEDDPGLPKGNVIRRNISVGGKWLDVDKGARPWIRFENNLVDKDPHFVDREKQDFRLRDDSPALQLGFHPIPIEKIGTTDDAYRRELPSTEGSS